MPAQILTDGVLEFQFTYNWDAGDAHMDQDKNRTFTYCTPVSVNTQIPVKWGFQSALEGIIPTYCEREQVDDTIANIDWP